MKRRNFLKGSLIGAAIPALAASSQVSLADSLAAWSAGNLDMAVSDARFAASRRFGSAAQQAGLKHWAIDGDVTGLWYEQLDPQWRKGPATIAGMTARQPLFILERLAWDRGMRVVLRVEHEQLADGSIQHRLNAPAHQLTDLTRLLHGRDDWSERLARLSGSCSWGLAHTPCAEALAYSPASDRQPPLVSWVIARA